MPRKEHHIVHDPNGGWNVKQGGSPISLVHTQTKAEAEAIGRSISQSAQSELVIHGLDGKIQRSDSHGNDPNPPAR